MHISALPSEVSCLDRKEFEGFKASALPSSREILLLSSAAAALVKVTISIEVISAGRSGSVRSLIILSVNVAVLPDPAAADTSIFLLRRSIASF